MKIKVIVSTDKHLSVHWPEGLPLPSKGDHIVMRSDTEPFGFVVDSKLYSIGTDPMDGSPMTLINIRGHEVPG